LPSQPGSQRSLFEFTLDLRAGDQGCDISFDNFGSLQEREEAPDRRDLSVFGRRLALLAQQALVACHIANSDLIDWLGGVCQEGAHIMSTGIGCVLARAFAAGQPLGGSESMSA
jgi:hypothetical protein